MGGLRIGTNIGALAGARLLGENRLDLEKALQRIATGLRINRAGDDAAGLAVAERLSSLTRGFDQAQDNIQTGISAIQIAEGGISQINSSLQRIRELAVQAANGTLSDADRALIQDEVDELVAEIDRQAATTTFNGQPLLNGTFASPNGLTLQVGPNKGDTITLDIPATNAAGLGLTGLSVSTQTAAQNALTTVSNAIDTVSSRLGQFGATQNRLERAMNFTGIARENTLSAESRIRDLDFGEGITDLARRRILDQTGIAALAQANLAPQRVLQLLG